MTDNELIQPSDFEATTFPFEKIVISNEKLKNLSNQNKTPPVLLSKNPSSTKFSSSNLPKKIANSDLSTPRNEKNINW